jgi:glycine cleavage system H protein
VSRRLLFFARFYNTAKAIDEPEATMSDLIFLMGKYEARFPVDRRYARNHLWMAPVEGTTGRYRVGFTAYSVRLLRDIYFLDWAIGDGTPVEMKQEIGQIESSKAVSNMYAPANGTIVRFNQEVAVDPSPINADNYGRGWLFEMTSDERFLEPAEYLAHVAAGWDDAQRMIKKQVHEQS